MTILKGRRIGLLMAATGLWASAAVVQAQNAATGPTQPVSDPTPLQRLQEVVVTGTLIRAPNLVSVSPIQTVSSEEIQAQGATNIEDVLNSLPQVYTAQTDTTSNNGTGVANLNLRGLGPTRTLVLLDGLRLGPGDPQNQFGCGRQLHSNRPREQCQCTHRGRVHDVRLGRSRRRGELSSEERFHRDRDHHDRQHLPTHAKRFSQQHARLDD
jgi:hypothetical protein